MVTLISQLMGVRNLAGSRAIALGTLLLGNLALSCGPEPLSVTTTADGGRGSLRAAIDRANASGLQSIRIEVPPGTYALTQCGADDTNAGGDLDITVQVPITIVATEPGVVIQQTCEGERVFEHHGQS